MVDWSMYPCFLVLSEKHPLPNRAATHPASYVCMFRPDQIRLDQTRIKGIRYGGRTGSSRE